MKVELDLEIPEGYEIAEGKARAPKKDEWFMDLASDRAHLASVNFTRANYIILKKKEPEYKTFH